MCLKCVESRSSTPPFLAIMHIFLTASSFLLLLITVTTAALVIPNRSRQASSLVISATTGSSIDDLERARQGFEAAMSNPIGRPLLTSSGRKRRQVELELLESLQDDDEAVEELMMLWLCERDAAATQRLQSMEQKCSDGLVEEEAYLRQLVADYGVEEWVEPASRLACLLFYKGRTQESHDLCQKVLQHKPWHFEALHLNLLNALIFHSADADGSKVLLWRAARKTLPPLNYRTNHRRRRAWVKRAMEQARESLAKAEQALMDATNTFVMEHEPSAVQAQNLWQ